MTWDIIESNPEYDWDGYWLSRNEFNYNQIVFKREYEKADMDMDEIMNTW